MDEDEINEYTGFMNGDLFENDEEIREYFTIENMIVMFNECNLTQAELNDMGDIVIENRFHMK